jgi:hypothetical protein
MGHLRLQEHEIEHIRDMRRLDEEERTILYNLAHRWRLHHDDDEIQQLASVIQLVKIAS